MFEVDCKFKNGGKTYSETRFCYALNDCDLPSYIPKTKLQSHAKSLKESDYIQTRDDMIVPVIRAWEKFIRIPRGGTYSRWGIAKGLPVYFKRPKEYKAEYGNGALGNKGKGRNLTEKQFKFCRHMALEGDPIQALEFAGYATNQHGRTYAQGLLRSENIKAGIRRAFREQIEAHSEVERTFVVDRVKQLQDNAEEITSHIGEKIKQGGITAEDIELYRDASKTAMELLELNARWLGYYDKAR